MNILVTGAKGFIGGHFVRHLTAKGYSVIGIDKDDPWPDFSKLDWVIHCGAITETDASDVDEVFRYNVFYTSDLLEQCAKHNVHIQFSSSASVYGKTDSFKETDPVAPRNLYAWSKVISEKQLMRFYLHNRGHSRTLVQIFRYFNVFGQGGENKRQPDPFYSFAKQAAERKRVTLFAGYDHAARDFVPVSYLVDVQEKFLNINAYGIYNIGTGNTLTFKEIAERQKVLIDYTPIPIKLRESYQEFTKADTSKLQHHLSRYNSQDSIE